MNVTGRHTFAVCAYKESPYLSACLRSLKAQTWPSNIIIATSTPSRYISDIAEQYGVPVFVNTGESGITQDWNFAYSIADTEYVTIAHQDDLYGKRYTENMIQKVEKSDCPLIYFTDYAEVRGERIVNVNRLLCIKRLMLFPLLLPNAGKSRWIRRRILSLGSPICCPSVTFVKENLPETIFANHFRADEDWEAWERISKLKGDFIFCPKILTLHRIHEESETTKILKDNKRTEEDMCMFEKFWPRPIARSLSYLYRSSESSNSLK